MSCCMCWSSPGKVPVFPLHMNTWSVSGFGHVLQDFRLKWYLQEPGEQTAYSGTAGAVLTFNFAGRGMRSEGLNTPS